MRFQIHSVILIVTMFMILSLPVLADNPYQDFHTQYEAEYQKKHTFREHWVSSPEHNLYVREYGETGDTPTFVLMHGFPDNLHLYDRLAPLLAKSAHVVSFDFLGWGHSDKPADVDYSILQQIDNLEAVVDYFSLQKVILVIHDMSGPPGLDWAMANGDRLRGLVLLNTYYGPMPTLLTPEAIDFYATLGDNREQILNYVKANDGVWFAGFLEQMSKLFVKQKVFSIYSKLFASQSLDIQPAFFQLTRTLYSDVGNNAIKQTSLLPSISKKVLVIFGEQDPYLNTGVAKAFHSLFGNSELYLLQNAGHFVQLDRPRKVAKIILHHFSLDDR